jgi:hypothetical protein
MVKILLDKKANIEVKDQYGNTPLIIGIFEYVNYLLN